MEKLLLYEHFIAETIIKCNILFALIFSLVFVAHKKKFDTSRSFRLVGSASCNHSIKHIRSSGQ